MACVNPNDPRFQEILKRVENPLLAEIEYDKQMSEGTQSVKSTQISKKIKDDLPSEVADAVTVVDEVPLDILGRDDLFLSMKAIFEENNITDPLLINWAGVNKAIIGHPRNIKSEQQLLDIIQRRYNEKQKETNHPELKKNPLALKSFNEWKDALKSYPIVFQDIMLGHAIKYLRNPNRRSKYVLQLSKVALTNTYGILVNQPNEANRLGKLYDMEVISSLTDALDYEPSASGAGYWVHIPRTENDRINLGFSSYANFEKSKKEDIERVKRYIAEEEKKKDPALYEKLKKEFEDLLNKETKLTTQEPNLNREDADKYGFKGYNYVRVESTYSRWENKGYKPHSEILGEDYEGYYINGYNTQAASPYSTRILPITREQAEEIWKEEVKNYPTSALVLEDRQTAFKLEAELSNIKPESIEDRIASYNIQLQDLEQQLKDITPDNWEKLNASTFKKNVDLLRKLSPSTWCTASSMTEHYVANYDNYLLIVNGVTVAGIEAYPDRGNSNKINVEGKLKILKENINNFVKERDNQFFALIPPPSVIGRINYDELSYYSQHSTKEEAVEKFYNQYIKPLEKELETLNNKIQVKEVTSRANNGTASIDHLDDTIAFFEKHNLDLENRTIKNAIRAREKGMNDSELEREQEIVAQGMQGWEGPEDWEGPVYEPWDDYDPRYEQEYYQAEMEREQQIDTVAAMNTIEEVRENLQLVLRYFNHLKEEFRSNQEIATAAVLRDSHYIANVPNNAPFYMDLAVTAVGAQPYVFPYLSDEAKNIPGLRERYDEYNRDLDTLPFSKTKNNLIQGYYDPKNDKVVVVASNAPVDEASKIAIHEVAHRGMLRMAKELGGVEQLNQALLNAEKELMRKVPELLKRTGHVTVDELVRDYGFERNSKEGRMKLLMELAARWAETLVDKPKPSWWKQFLKNIGEWIKQFTGAVLNEKEVNELVGGFVKYGTAQVKEQTPIQFNRKLVNVPTAQEQNTKISQSIINALAETLGINLGVKFTQITSEQARQMDANWTNEPAFYLNGVVYIVDGAMTLENVLHEFSHPLFDAIYMSNRKLFDKLYTETTKTTEGAAIVAAVKEAYPEYDENGDMFKKEVMVRALTTVAEAQVLKQETSKSFKDVIKKMLFAIKQMLRSVFGNSIKIEKLDVNTSLKDLAKMLRGEKFDINTDLVSPKDVAQYSRNVDEFVNSFNKLEDDKLIEIIDNLNRETLISIGKVKNAKNIDEIKSKLINDKQQGVLDRILDTLAKGTTLNESIAKIENEEKKRSLNAHNFVHSILQIEQFITYLKDNFSDIVSNQQGQELVSSLNAYQKLLSNWSDFIKYTTDSLIDNGMNRSSPLGAKLSIMSKDIENLNEDIVRSYGPGVVNVLKEALTPLMNTLQEHYATHLEEVEKKYAENPSPKLLKYIENLKAERDNFTLDDKKIKDLMIGRYGDTNIFSAYLEAYSNSPDPIVGGLAMFIKNAYTDVENRFQSDMQDYKKDIYSLLEKAGYSRNQFTKVNEKLLFKNKTYFYNTLTGELEEREEWTFLNPLQDETFYMAQFKQQYEEAKAAGDKEKMEEIRIAQKKHRRKYFHQRYKDEFYQREDIYDDFNTYFEDQLKKYEQSLISQGVARGTREFRNKVDTWRKREDVRLVAYEILGIDPVNATAAQIEEVNRIYMEAASEALKRKNELLVDIGVKQNETWDEENFEDIAEELEQDWRQYGRLASQTDMLGNPKIGKERLMSAIERKFRKDTNEFYDWKPKENAFEIALDKFEQTLLDAGIVKNSDEFNQKRDIWIKKNTVISYTPEWYEQRNEKIVRLKELMAKLPEETRKQVDTSEELELLLGLSVGFRDKDGQIIGDEMSDASKQKVKDLQEAILEKRSQMAGLSGLTKEEMNTLTELFTKIKNRTGLTTTEQGELDFLLEKQDKLGVSKATKAEMSRIFAELSDLQQKEPTTYYLDAINNWMEFLGEPPIDEMNVDDLYDMGKINVLFAKSPEFQEWFEKNHILKESYKAGPTVPGTTKGPAVYELKYERMFIWSRTRPTDPTHYENFKLTTGEIIPGKPSLAYYSRTVKQEVINEKVIGKTVNNLGTGEGHFLPKSREDGAPADSPYINERYYELKAKEPKLFALLEKMKEYHLDWQRDALPESRLYMAIPKFRTKSSEALFRVSKNVKRWKQWFYNIRSWFKSAPDDQELGLSYDAETLARLEMVDEDIRKIPVHGIYDLDVNEVSLDISGGLMRYRMGTLKQSKLLELSPVAEAISQYIEQEEFIVKGADKALKGKKKKKMNRYEKKQAMAKVWDNLKRTGQYRKLKRKKSTRLTAIDNLLEREFQGITQQEWVSKAPGVIKVKNFVTKAASTAFFGLNPLGAFKNKIAAQVQSLIEAGGGKYISMRSLARGKWTSFVMLSKHTMEIYSSKSNSIEVQMMQVFNPGQELLQEYEKDSFTRTALTDAVNFSFLTNPRKWLQYKATLDVFNGMMFHQTVDLYYRNKSQKIYYAEAFEMVNGKIRLKEGIDPEWANYPVDHSVERGETAESIAGKYGITVEELYKRNKLEADAEILPGDVLEIGRSRQFKAFKNRMHELTNRLEGAFAKFDRTEADRNFFFQLMIFMKRFFGHMAGNYFAGRRTSAALGDISIGNWPGFVKTIQNLFKYGTGYLQYQRSEERAAAKRMITAVLTIAAFYMLRSFWWDWDWLDSSTEAHNKIKARSGDYFADDYNRQGFMANWELALMMGVLTETETWTNPVVFINTIKGIPDPGTVSDQALIKPTTIIAEYLAYINKQDGSVYKQDAGPYSWQKKDQPKWKASFMKMLGFTGANFDPNKAIENLERYNRTFSGTK